MANKLEKSVRDPSVRDAKRHGVVYKRMHFGHGAETGWPDDLFVFLDGHHWWVEFKAPGKPPEPKQEHVHEEMRKTSMDVSVIDGYNEFCEAFVLRVQAHGSLC